MIRNPFRTSGKFLIADMVAVVEEQLKHTRSYSEMLLRQRRMRQDNFDKKIGALEATLAFLKERLVREARAGVAESERERFIIYLRDPNEVEEFLNWAAEKRFDISSA